MRFADDTSLTAESSEETAILLTHLEDVSKEYALTINKNRTKTLIVDTLIPLA